MFKLVYKLDFLLNTKKLLLFSNDSDLIGIVRMSALTLTKLNCQVDFEFTGDVNTILTKSKAADLNLIIIDNVYENDSLEIIGGIRKDRDSKSKKIILLYQKEVDRQKFYNQGCDSIMSKSEFSKSVNNILIF